MRFKPCFYASIALFSLFAGETSQAVTTPKRVAVFDFELIDTSLGGEINGVNAAETARLASLAPRVRSQLAKTTAYSVVNIQKVEALAKAQNLQACGGCDVGFAATVGADISITGTVQKVSELILNINLYLRDVATGSEIRQMSVDIRGNTDESWSRGMDYLIKNELLAQPQSR